MSWAASLRYGQCGDDFMVLPGEKEQSPIEPVLSHHFFDKQGAFILCKDCTKGGFFSAMLVGG
jgi:hypothetical protein